MKKYVGQICNYTYKTRYRSLVSGLKRLQYTVVPSDRDSFKRAVKRYKFLISSDVRSRSWATMKRFKGVGISTLITELGYYNRANTDGDPGYYQLGWDALGWVNPVPSPERWEALNLQTRKNHYGSGPVLIAAQMPGDAQHRLSFTEMQVQYKKYADAAKDCGYDVVLRPHPKDYIEHWSEWCDRNNVVLQNPSDVNLTDALKETRYLMLFNSTVGADAVRLGVPFWCWDGCWYSQWRSNLTDPLTAPIEDRLEWLYRVANSQWEMSELISGKALRATLPHIPQ